jgi:hypothetical protein
VARARAFAKRMLGSRREIAAEDVARACREAWGREADPAEVQLALDFIAAQAADRRKARPPAPAVKFPNETGLRPVTQNFGGVGEIPLGSRALWLQPGSRFERLHLPEVRLAGDTFTIEAVVQLDAIQKDASVNTLVSRWNGDPASSGWALGVTSEKSRYQPRNLIVQLVGANPGGDLEYEVVASGLLVPTGKPVYLAAAIQPRPNGEGMVRFYLKDLSDSKAELQMAEVPHNISGAVQNAAVPMLIGGRDEKRNGHLWDGQVGRLSITDGALEADQLLVTAPQPAGGDVLNVLLEGENGAEPIPGAKWLKKPAPARAASDPVLDAFADFCHALLSSNEFLYLH